jgi:hypothetical protein
MEMPCRLILPGTKGLWRQMQVIRRAESEPVGRSDQSDSSDKMKPEARGPWLRRRL